METVALQTPSRADRIRGALSRMGVHLYDLVWVTTGGRQHSFALQLAAGKRFSGSRPRTILRAVRRHLNVVIPKS